MIRLAAALLVLCGSVFFGLAQAHERSESTSHWTLADGELHGVVTTRAREITRLTLPGDSYASLPQLFSAHVERSLTASVDDVPCTLRQTPSVLESEPGYVRVNVAMHCSPGQVLTLKVDLFFGVAPSHHHFLYLETSGASREAILSASAPVVQLQLRNTTANPTQFLQFVGMGLEHIASGIDHLAFLLALMIGVRRVRQLVAVVTGFTLGHSLTLSLAVLGIVQANRGAVECLIGLTIALAAARNLLRAEPQGRLAGFTLAAGFGLIHGLGFAGALQDLHLPRALLLPSLAGFNVGVEIGQLLVVMLAVLGCAAIRSASPGLGRRSEQVAALASGVLLAVGLSWFLTRAVG